MEEELFLIHCFIESILYSPLALFFEERRIKDTFYSYIYDHVHTYQIHPPSFASR